MIRYIRKSLKIFKSIKKIVLLRAIGYLFLLLLIGLLGIYFAEGGVNSRFKDPLDVLYFLLTVSTVGYEDLHITTFIGKFFLVFTLYGTIIISALLSAIVASLLIEFKLKDIMGMGQFNFSDHFVIIGWNRKGPMIIKILRKDPNFEDMKIVVVSKEEKKPPNIEDINFVHTDTYVSSKASLLKASVQKAKTVVLLADYSQNEGSDNTTSVNCLMVRSLNKSALIVAEMLAPQSREHIEAAGANFVIGVAEIGGALIAESCKNLDNINLNWTEFLGAKTNNNRKNAA